MVLVDISLMSKDVEFSIQSLASFTYLFYESYLSHLSFMTWIIWRVNFLSFFFKKKYILDLIPFCSIAGKDFLPFCDSLHSVVSLAARKIFEVHVIPLVYACCDFLCHWRFFRKSLPMQDISFP